MAKIKLQTENGLLEVDMTVAELKEFIGRGDQKQNLPPAAVSATLQVIPTQLKLQDFDGFMKAISERGEMFVEILSHHPDGIDAYELAAGVGYADPRQIGGLAGGGLAKIAKKFGVRLKDVYTKKITFPDGKRTVTFYPGKHVLALAEHKKPA